MTGSERLTFLADVHVPRKFCDALRADGFVVISARTASPPGTEDDVLLGRARERSAVVVTNDRDFAAIHDSVDHAGIVIYTSASHTASEFRRGIRRIDRQFTVRTIENVLLWLEEWL